MMLRQFFIFLFLIHHFVIGEEQRVVLITGANKGIGLEAAKKLSETGYRVFASFRTTSNREILDLAAKEHGNITPVQLDVTDENSISLAVQKILNETGKIDIVINNACEVIIGTSETLTLEEQMRMMDVNYFGAVRVLQAVLPHMRKQNQGHIINMSSVSGFTPFPITEGYVASKFALEGLSESLAVYLDQWNIKVTLIEPAGVKTDLSLKANLGTRFLDETLCFKNFCEEGKKSLQNSYGSFQPPEEIASLICKILEEETPHLRYQTNHDSLEMAKERFKDPTGDFPLFLKRIKQRTLLKFLTQNP